MAFRESNIQCITCRDDADTTVVANGLDLAEKTPVSVKAEDTDILALLIHHFDNKIHHKIFFTTSDGSYDIDLIRQKIPSSKLKYLLPIYSFTGCDTVSSIFGYYKSKLFDHLSTSS